MTSGVAGRYAAALFDLAKDAGSLDTVHQDLTDLKRLLGESADLTELVRSPLFSRDERPLSGQRMAAHAAFRMQETKALTCSVTFSVLTTPSMVMRQPMLSLSP